MDCVLGDALLITVSRVRSPGGPPTQSTAGQVSVFVGDVIRTCGGVAQLGVEPVAVDRLAQGSQRAPLLLDKEARQVITPGWNRRTVPYGCRLLQRPKTITTKPERVNALTLSRLAFARATPAERDTSLSRTHDSSRGRCRALRLRARNAQTCTDPRRLGAAQAV